MTELSISIVTYRPDMSILTDTLSSLSEAASALIPSGGCEVYLVDNGDELDNNYPIYSSPGMPITLIKGQGNVGFGSGHNLAISRVNSVYHLILNPDVIIMPNALVNALSFMNTHLQCSLLAPSVKAPDGVYQFLCKRKPSLLDLFLRGFAPKWLKSKYRNRLNHYEMRDFIADEVVWNPPIISGSFMFFRTSVLKDLGGFDPRFFLYFEDFDLSLRASSISYTAYVPSVRIIHYGGNAARKGIKHLLMFTVSAFRYFRKHGWKWL